MTRQKPIAYEPHPVSPQRKAELVKAGYCIVDVIYKPKDEPTLGPAVSTTTVQETGTNTASGAQPSNDDDKDHPGDMTKAELVALLTESGIPFSPTAKKKELLALLESQPQS